MKQRINSIIRRLTAFTAAFFIAAGFFSHTCFYMCARAEVWPYPGGEITAESAVVMDADTGAVLWGRNQDVQYYPASITKIMTALVVLENCELDEKVPITANAVYGLESGATNVALSVDDILTVEDLLNALLLRSANDAANALAIYVGGSVSGFAEMMNEKAAELGCENTDFRNPSGLTDDEHMTTAYDMALIMRACVNNQDFLDIEANDKYKLSPTKRYPGGLTVSMEHKMMIDGTGYTDDRVIAGKTGFITASGNTLVTCAKQDGRRVIAVVLKDRTPYHYTDTEKLLDFGFSQFENLTIDDPVGRFDSAARLVADKICTGQSSDNIVAYGDAVVTVPKGSGTDAISVRYEYNLKEDAPDRSVALLKFYMEDRNVGSVYLLNDSESTVGIASLEPDTAAKAAVGLSVVIAAAAGAALLLTGGLKAKAVKDEKLRRQRFIEKRNQRLESMGMSVEEFEQFKNDSRMKSRQRRNERSGSYKRKNI